MSRLELELTARSSGLTDSTVYSVHIRRRARNGAEIIWFSESSLYTYVQQIAIEMVLRSVSH